MNTKLNVILKLILKHLYYTLLPTREHFVEPTIDHIM